MSTKKTKHGGSDEKIMELQIDGHPVTLSFAAEPDASVAQRVRSYLIDSYIRQNGLGHSAA